MMGLLQKAVETYDHHTDLIGQIREGHEIFAPVGHTVTRAQIEITIDTDGKFLSAREVLKDEPKIVIPVTEESCGRTSGLSAHPLCDQIGYVAAYNQEKHQLYIEQLRSWYESDDSHPKLKPILDYVEGGTILSDLSSAGLIKLDASGIPEKERDTLIRWVVNSDNGDSGACWKDRTLFSAYTKYYESQQTENRQSLCMISGEVSTIANQHARGIVPAKGKAKLISSNDKDNFTYRGRFAQDWQAATVSYEASQKAHNALRWLVAEQGVQVVFGGRTFLCWNPRGIEITTVTGPFRMSRNTITKPSDYRDELRRTLSGYQTELKPDDDVVIAAFDAATSGRLSLTYYNELLGSDFLERLYAWDTACCWYNGRFGIQSPALLQIVSCAYGTQRTEKGQVRLKADDRVVAQQMQRMVSCRIDRARVPADLIHSLVHRASMPMNYEPEVWRRIVFTACAVLHCRYLQEKGEESMSWELDKADRSFQFGRLLAAMERVEADYYYKSNEERQTTAMKSLNEFRRNPYHTYERVNRHLMTAYVPRIDPYYGRRYERLKQEIMQIIKTFPEEELNRPLDDIYLMGYDLQKNEFFTKAETINEPDEEEA